MRPADADAVHGPAHAGSDSPARAGAASVKAPTVLRFTRTERVYHWAQALPFMVLLATGGIILLQRASGRTMLTEDSLEVVHKVAGVAMPSLILITFAFGDRKVLLANARMALKWGMDDLRWLVLFPIHNFMPSVRVPASDKFNSGQKINLLAQMLLQPLFLLTGLAIWLRPAALLPWIVHVVLFGLAVPLVLGHMHLALVNRNTRKGLSGVFTGRVDARWAAEHYPKAYAPHEADAT